MSRGDEGDKKYRRGQQKLRQRRKGGGKKRVEKGR